MMKKRMLALFLALALCLGLLPLTAFAAESDFIIEDGVLTKYNGPGGDVVIPAGVTAIDFQAFQNCTTLTSVVIPEGVTEIKGTNYTSGIGAFRSCTALIDVTLPKGLNVIGPGAFINCTSLTEIVIPDGVTEIGSGAFAGCSALTTVTIPSTVTSIMEDFSYLNPFFGTPWMSKQGDLVIVNGILLEYQGTGGNVTIPNGVTKICADAFSYKPVTDVMIPAGVTSIGFSAFRASGLTNVYIPDTVKEMETYAFVGCKSLTSATIGSNNIGFASFEDCTSLTDITLLDGVTQIEFAAFDGCSALASATIPASVTEIDDSAFKTFHEAKGEENVEIDYYETLPNLTIYGETGSQAEAYAKENSIPFVPLNNKPVAVTGVSLNKSTASVQVGKNTTLTAAVKPNNASNKGVYWTSDDTYVVTVDTNGKLTGVKTGTANVTVTTVDGGFTATCAVTVYTSSSGGGGGSSSGGGGASGGGGGGGAAKPSAQPSQKPIDTSKSASENFGDVVKGSWYESGVTYVVQKGLFQGVADKTFAPQQNMTRAMLVTVLARLDGQDTTGGETWYAKATDWAKAQGVSDGTMLESSVTREQMVTMLYRYAKAQAGTADLSAFADGSTVSDWAKDAMAWAVDRGILTGKDGNRLDPQGTATRAEVATILQRFVEQS